MFLEELNNILTRIAESFGPDEIREIKNDYQILSGAIFDDDRSYESRLASFLEWFVLERIIPDSTETALERFIRTNRDSTPPEQLRIYKDFTKSIHGIFIIKKFADEAVTVHNLLDDKKYKVSEAYGKSIFQKNDIFEGRIFSHFDKIHFTGSFCFHPPKSGKFIKSKIKTLRRTQKKTYDEMAKLSRNLKSLQIDLNSVSSDINKLAGKIEKTTSENKLKTLQGKMESLEDNLSAISEDQTIMKARAVNWETVEIKTKCGEQSFQLIQKFSYMSLKWERSRQIDIKDIYKN